jgi:hypothetical protein
MSTRGVADIVFCLDASESMVPCFDGVKDHVVDFIEGLRSDGQTVWDLRFDVVALQCGLTGDGRRLWNILSVFHDDLWMKLYKSSFFSSGHFFTSSIREFRDGISRIELKGNESSLISLDFALDFPWRKASKCHRIVIMMTDEPFETGAGEEDRKKIPALIEKIQDLRVMLFLVTPESRAFARLAEVDRCEHWVVDETGRGLAGVNFSEVMSYIGKSVSVSTLQQGGASRSRRGLFGQSSWVRTTGSFSE